MSTVQSPAGIVIPALADEAAASNAPAVSNLFYVIEFYITCPQLPLVVDFQVLNGVIFSK